MGHLLQGVVRNVLKEMIPELNHKRQIGISHPDKVETEKGILGNTEGFNNEGIRVARFLEMPMAVGRQIRGNRHQGGCCHHPGWNDGSGDGEGRLWDLLCG